MPFSDNQGKSAISEWIKKINPLTALDIGPGAGVYSNLVRASAPILQVLDAVEAWGPYVEQFSLLEKYDNVMISDVMLIDRRHLSKYDLVIIGDVIEHLTRQEASDIIKWLAAANKNLIISFPVLHLDQDSYEGNFFEIHRDHWSYADMLTFCENAGIKVLDSGTGDVLAWFWLKG